MSPAELAAYCAAPSILSIAGTVALMVIAAFVGRICVVAFVGRMRGRIEMPPSVAGVVVVAAGSVAVMLIVELVNMLSALAAACSGTLAETMLLTLLFAIAAACGIRGATMIAPRLFAEFETVADPEPEQTRTDALMVPAAVTYARLGTILMSRAAQHGHAVTWAEVYGLLPRVDLFEALPPADSDRLIFKLAADVLNGEAIRIGSQRRTTPAEIRELVAA